MSIKIKNVFYVIVVLLSLTSCKGFFEDENDSSAQFSSSNDTKPLLTGVKIQSSSWHSFNELKGIGLEFDNFIKTKLDQTKRGISLRLTGDVRDYKISKVEVFQKSKKRGAEGGFFKYDWPLDSNGVCERELYINTGFTGRNGFYAYLSAVYGSVKPSMNYSKDFSGNLWKQVSETDLKYYSYSGNQSEIKDSVLRLPEKIGETVPTAFGRQTFDLFGMKNVTVLVVPENYRILEICSFWENVNLQQIYYEGNENNLTTFNLSKSSIMMYRENEPNPETDDSSYTYWHYVNEVPTIW